MIKIKRVYDAFESSDGFRVLIDRLWPRGVSHTQARIDEWLKEVAPSDELRKWFNHKEKRWAAFKTRYRREIKDTPEAKEAFKALKKLMKENEVITLLYAAKDTQYNNAVALQYFLGIKQF